MEKNASPLNRYRIAYSHRTGLASCDFNRTQPIRNVSDLQEVQEKIEQATGWRGVVITAWSKFED